MQSPPFCTAPAPGESWALGVEESFWECFEECGCSQSYPVAWKGSLGFEILPAGLRGAQGDGSGVAQSLWSLRNHCSVQLVGCAVLGQQKEILMLRSIKRESVLLLCFGGFCWGIFGGGGEEVGVFFVCFVVLLWGFFVVLLFFLS